jgi:hypothetical protein
VLVLQEDDPGEVHLLIEGLGRLVARGQFGPELDGPVLECLDGTFLREVGEEADTGGEHQVLAGRLLQDVLEPVLERLVPLWGHPIHGPLGATSLAGRLRGLDPAGRLELLDGPVEGAHLALGIVLPPVVHQPLHLVRVEGALGEQGERGQGDGPLRRSAYALRHIAFRTIACCRRWSRRGVAGFLRRE